MMRADFPARVPPRRLRQQYPLDLRECRRFLASVPKAWHRDGAVLPGSSAGVEPDRGRMLASAGADRGSGGRAKAARQGMSPAGRCSARFASTMSVLSGPRITTRRRARRRSGRMTMTRTTRPARRASAACSGPPPSPAGPACSPRRRTPSTTSRSSSRAARSCPRLCRERLRFGPCPDGRLRREPAGHRQGPGRRDGARHLRHPGADRAVRPRLVPGRPAGRQHQHGDQGLHQPAEHRDFRGGAGQRSGAADPYEAALPGRQVDPQFAPVHTYHLGVWFNSPDDAKKNGCPTT